MFKAAVPSRVHRRSICLVPSRPLMKTMKPCNWIHLKAITFRKSAHLHAPQLHILTCMQWDCMCTNKSFYAIAVSTSSGMFSPHIFPFHCHLAYFHHTHVTKTKYERKINYYRESFPRWFD